MIVNIIDVSGFVYRSFYGLPSMQYNGNEVGAVYGFCNEILKLRKTFPTAMFIAALDSGKKTFRNEIYSEYKSNRPPMPSELASQLPIIREAVEAFGFVRAECVGYEADDIISSYVRKIADCHIPVNIITSDKDLLQLIDSDRQIFVFDPVKQKRIVENNVVEKFGVGPKQVLDILALMGDSSDNIPGVPGIGSKTAALLINKFHTLENLIDNIDTLPKLKKYETLRQNIEMAVLSKKLATLFDGLDVKFEYCQNIPNGLTDFLNKYKFKSLLGKV